MTKSVVLKDFTRRPAYFDFAQCNLCVLFGFGTYKTIKMFSGDNCVTPENSSDSALSRHTAMVRGKVKSIRVWVNNKIVQRE